MKLLLDQNLSRRLVPLLEAYYPGTTQVALLNKDQDPDSKIWQYARSHNFVIVTKDSDFQEMSLLRGAPPKVIWLKLGNTKNAVILNALVNNQAFIEQTLSAEDINCLEIC